MSKGKVPFDSSNTQSSNGKDSPVEKIKKMYLPESKADYQPSEESIEQANGLSHPKPLDPSSLI